LREPFQLAKPVRKARQRAAKVVVFVRPRQRVDLEVVLDRLESVSAARYFRQRASVVDEIQFVLGDAEIIRKA